jgi:hypothetical protein
VDWDKKRSIKLISKFATKTSRGMLSKGWYNVDGGIYLVKGNSKGSYEPFAEYIGSRIVSKITNGFAIPYDLEPAELYPEVKTFSFPFVSICPRWEPQNTAQFSRYVDAVEQKEVKDYSLWVSNKAPSADEGD